ncbi:MAG TPA: ABC transporter ATP-binding protein [Solirubrobacteraceae bacterium]|nr:ABC transporter ATP-binding protein [Solirubrobacteraceae bacterium]
MSPGVARGGAGGGGGGGGRWGSTWTGEKPSRGTRGRNLRGLIQMIRPYRWRAVATAAALVVGTAAALAPPLLAKVAIDEGIDKHDTETLVLVVIAFLFAAVLVLVTTYAQTYLVGWIGQRTLADLRIRIFCHLQQMPIGFYESRPAGVLISRITNDVEALESLVTDSVVTLFQAGLTLAGTVVILLVLDVKLALITFLVFPFLIAGSMWFRFASATAFRRTRETIGAVTAYLQETLSGIRIVRTFGQERHHEAAFAALNDDNREANMKTVYLNAAYFPAVEMLSGIAIAVIVFYGGSQAIDGVITLGTVVAFVGTLSNVFEPIQQLSQLYTTYQSGMAALEKIFQLLDEEPNLTDAEDALELPRLEGEITFQGTTFAYARRRGAAADPAPALDHIDLDVAPGETIALVGATGAGKSTMAKLVARFYDPTSGRVLVDGHDLRTVSSHSLRSQMGIVPQEAFLFAGTIAENVRFGRPDATDAEVHAAIEAVGADAFVADLPAGIDAQVGERGSQLSAGQRQLIAFARALIADPRILVLDEATSNVDLHTETRIEEALKRLLTGRTSIVIAHRLSTIRQAARIIVLEHGRIAEQGSHDELIAARGRYFELYRDWAEQAAV